MSGTGTQWKRAGSNPDALSVCLIVSATPTCFPDTGSQTTNVLSSMAERKDLRWSDAEGTSSGRTCET